MPEAVVGHTAGRVYPMLGRMTYVLNEVQDEATANRLLTHLAVVRATAKTDIDRRALDLLELMVERRCAELKNQPGTHVAKALAAMRRAFPEKPSPGEPRLLADFLRTLGTISQAPLADEQCRQLKVLHANSAVGSLDRLHIARQAAYCEFQYLRYNQAIDLMQSSLDEYQTAAGGILPPHANESLRTLISFLDQRGHFARAERILLGHLEQPIHRQQAYSLTEQLVGLYRSALARDGETSLGKGETLFKAVVRKVRGDLDTVDQSHRYRLVNELCQFYYTADQKKIPGVADNLRDFAFRQFPDVLKRQTNYYESIVSRVAVRLHETASPRDGLAFLIERLENEPRWFRYTNDDGWSQQAMRFAEWRLEVKPLGDLENRLLAVVLTELRRDLETRQHRNRVIYHRQRYTNEKYYWAEKTDDFAKTAEAVLKSRTGSSTAVSYIADYMFSGLGRHDRAIEVLFAAHRREILDESGVSRLARYLHETNSYGQEIGLLEPLVRRQPGSLDYCIRLMRAYYLGKRREEMAELLAATDKYFHEGDRWSESVLYNLAESCRGNGIYEQAAKYYEELIPLHRRTHPGRGVGNGTLANYLGHQADVYSNLGRTKDAVQAACDAIVCWGRTDGNRQNALNTLDRVLGKATDLDGYIGHLDAEAEKNNSDLPIVRKALGKVLMKKGQYAKAIVQLTLAVQLQPNDTETHEKLVTCYDKLEDPHGAARQLLASIGLSPRDINLYENLGDRMKDLGRADEAERAYTSMVEMLPNESEGHAALANIRQRDDRYDEAILHWEHVARIRALEPTGLIGLTQAQVHQGQWDAAAATLKKLRARSWPVHFPNAPTTIGELQRQIDAKRPAE